MNDNFKAGYNGLSNEGEAKYVHPEQFEKDKAEFMSLYNYFKQRGEKDYEEWFDKKAIDKFIHGKIDPHYSNELRGKTKGHQKTCTTRIPTRCEKCGRVWAYEYMTKSFQHNFLDPEVYTKNLPMVKGDCHECREEK